jgi:hypothetical protein
MKQMTPQEALIQLSCLASYHEDEISSTDKSQSSMEAYRTKLTQTIQVALERLPKVEKLLVLYRQIRKTRTMDKYHELCREIETIEKELKTL